MAEEMEKVKEVLQFLTRNGFYKAALSLSEDIVARRGFIDWWNLGLDPILPPVRIEVGRSKPSDDDSGVRRGNSLDSLSEDEFLSIECSSTMEDDIKHANQSGRWPSVGKADLLGSTSEFSTARDCNFSSMFNGVNWYDENFCGCLHDSFQMPTDSFVSRSNDNFSMTMQSDHMYGKEKNSEFTSKKGICCCLRMSEAEGLCEMKAPRKSSEFISLSQSSQCKTPITFENEGEVTKTINRDSVQSDHSDCKLNSREDLTNRHVKPLERDLHILPLCSTHKSEIGGPEDGFLKNVLSDFSFHKEEQDLDSDTLEKDRHMLHFSLIGSSAHVNVEESFELKDKGEMVSHAHSEEYVLDENDDSDDDNANPICKANDADYEIFELRIVHGKNRTGFEENKDLPIVLNSVIAGRYCVTEYLGSATFSNVVQASDLVTGMNVCLKIIKNNKDFFDQSLDEIKLLRLVNKYDTADEHHILRLYDYFYHQEHLFLVCEVLKENLYEYQKYIQESDEELYYTLPRIQSIAKQCLNALEYLHNLGIIHCDLKPENIMIKSYSRCEIKIIDLGSSCFQTDNLTFYVQSRSYRAPEVILGVPYNQKIDIWSLGCILAELFTGEVLFPNISVATLLARMIGVLGPFDMEILNMGLETHKYFTDKWDIFDKNEETDQVEYIIPEKSSLVQHLNFPDGQDLLFTDFLTCLLQTNPEKRPTAAEALEHPWLIKTYQ
ncbi:hypothetical protein ZOSMA_114G00700 [Zostera marina]|uniref:Protein kinase domain-containing protein n=1 Tax=Zostera marina TaxID=29655 RepID=A0A0K9Q2H2_ZOSMR|nr:hypothetical protein ZOSMA_114G00700 [Zostera marina]